jgi:hypothetical protein
MSRFKLSSEKFTSITVPTANGSLGTKVIDVEACIKVYWPLSELMDDMSAVELKLIGYIMSQMTKGSDEVYIDPSDVLEYLNRVRGKVAVSKPINSHSYVYRGMKLLADRRIIAKKSSKVYYINPNMLFKGNRVSVLNK